MQWNTMFWFGSSKGSVSADKNNDNDILKLKMAKHEDICFGQESDVEIMDKLGNELEYDEDSGTSVELKEAHRRASQQEGLNSDNEACEATLCEFSPSICFSFQDFSDCSNSPCILDDLRCTEELVDGSDHAAGGANHLHTKHQHLRLVHGRLQVVGFNADCQDHTTNRTKFRRSRKRQTLAKPFWSELIYFLTK